MTLDDPFTAPLSHFFVVGIVFCQFPRIRGLWNGVLFWGFCSRRFWLSDACIHRYIELK
jgi:hypothetical protein